MYDIAFDKSLPRMIIMRQAACDQSDSLGSQHCVNIGTDGIT